jgi:glycine betaine/proline transport system substrate-binding protein
MNFSVRALRRGLGAAGLMLALLTAAGLGNTATAQDDKTVKLALLDWTGQEIANKIAGEILTRMGYNVEYVTTTQMPLFQALADGDVDAYMEQWLVTTRVVFEEYEAKGEVVSLGLLGIRGQEGWFYPTYVEADCPGLPDWQALAECEELFSAPETFPNGRIVDYPEEWTPDSQKWADALGLEFTAVPAGGEGAIAAEVKSAFARNEPVLVMFWQPHWVMAEYDMTMVALPEWEEACEEDAAWGVNPEATFDCGAPIPDIIKMAGAQLETEKPEVFKFLSAYTIDNAIQEPLMKRVEVDGEDLDAVVTQWVDENEAIWQPWVD